MTDSTATSLASARKQAKALEADVTRTSQNVKAFAKEFSFNDLLKPWVGRYVIQVGDSLIAKAKLQLATRHISASEVHVNHEIEVEIWEKVVKHFPFATLVEEYINATLKDGTASVVNSRAATQRDLVCTVSVE